METRKKIKYQDLPRKLKKRLRNCLLNTIDPAWKKHEVKIQAVTFDPFNMIRSKPDYKRFYVTDYRLG